MKSFKQHIDEEWIDSLKTSFGETDIYKNPTAREWKEYVQSLGGVFSGAGVFHGGDVYVFNGAKAFHANIIKKMNLSDAKSLSFRIVSTRAGNIKELEMGGEDSRALRSNKKKYKKYKKFHFLSNTLY